MSALPNGWGEASLLELAGNSGLMDDGDWIESKDQDPQGDVRLIQLADIGDGHFVDKSRRFLTSERAAALRCTYLQPGDLLIARMPDPLGRACIFPDIGMPAVTAVDVCIWRPSEDGADACWLMHFVNSPEVRNQIQSQASGTTRQRVSGGNLKRMTVPVPPAPEQRRIVAKLSSLRARSSRARQELDHIPKLIERYKQAILAKAFSGELTKEWRETNDVDEWQSVVIEDIAETIFDGPFGSNLKSDDYVDVGVRVVRLENIGHLAFKGDKQTFISEEKYSQLRRHTLLPADVIFSSFVDEEVRVCLFPENLGAAAINKADCFCIRTNRGICEPKWLAMRLACRSTYETLRDAVHGATRPRISLGTLKSFSFELPSMKEQCEIVRCIEHAFAWLDKIATEYARSNHLLPKLDQATLAKAFRGELVPQDPNDEPASVLLERIKAEREGGERPNRRRARSA